LSSPTRAHSPFRLSDKNATFTGGQAPNDFQRGADLSNVHGGVFGRVK
jgi:hypothetical protein